MPNYIIFRRTAAEIRGGIHPPPPPPRLWHGVKRPGFFRVKTKKYVYPIVMFYRWSLRIVGMRCKFFWSRVQALKWTQHKMSIIILSIVTVPNRLYTVVHHLIIWCEIDQPQVKKHFMMNIILIIHASECISGSATCIEDIYNDANRTSRGGGGGGPASSVCITLWMSEIMLQLR